ncbi:MAG: hypothetical protein ND866_28845 [Pyrinomonadaceae bacterium]|nr:hypothetical protein [Pyrinomonadaceae bacterium]
MRRLTLALDFTAARVVTLLAALGVFFADAVGVRFAKGFLTRLLDAADLDGAGLETLRLGDFVTAARFAFGRIDFVFTERPLRADFEVDRRAGVCDLDRLMPLVTGLLIRRFKSKGQLDA